MAAQSTKRGMSCSKAFILTSKTSGGKGWGTKRFTFSRRAKKCGYRTRHKSNTCTKKREHLRHDTSCQALYTGRKRGLKKGGGEGHVRDKDNN